MKNIKKTISIFFTISLFAILLGQAAYSQNLNNTGEVQAQDIRDNGLFAKFYQPAASGERPGVIIIGGSDGNLLSNKAKELAANGYPALALGYFGKEGLPSNLEEVPLEYFFKAIEWLRKKPGVDPNKIVLIGSSRGAEAALLVASKNRKVRGVIGYVPGYAAFGNLRRSLSQPEKPGWTFKGKPVPYLSGNTLPEFDTANQLRENRVDEAEVKQTMIKVERINGPILLFSSKTDKIWHSTAMSDAIIKRLKAKRFRFPYEHISYDDASHIILGKAPVRIKLPDNSEFYFGGTEEGTEKARKDSWKQVLLFLDKFRTKTESPKQE